MIRIGDALPEARFPRMGPEGPEYVTLSTLTNGRRVVIIGVPGAFTPTCDGKHLPSFVRTKVDFDAKGIDEAPMPLLPEQLAVSQEAFTLFERAFGRRAQLDVTAEVRVEHEHVALVVPVVAVPRRADGAAVLLVARTRRRGAAQ